MRRTLSTLLLVAATAQAADPVATEHQIDWGAWAGTSHTVDVADGLQHMSSDWDVYTNLTVAMGLDGNAISTIINTDCPASNVVVLGAGQWDLTEQISITTDYKVLRGTGVPDWDAGTGTRIKSTYSGSKIYIWARGWVDPDTGPETALLAAPVRGATNLHVTSTNMFQPGMLFYADQTNDWIDVDNVSNDIGEEPFYTYADGTYTREGGIRGYCQMFKVLNVGETNVHMEPPVAGTNWNINLDPEAWSWSSSLDDIIIGVGIENLMVTNASGTPSSYTYEWLYAEECWLDGVVGHMSNFASVWADHTYRCSVTDSEFRFDDNYQSQSYGIKTDRSGYNRYENNKFDEITTPIMIQSSTIGHAVLYNYMTNMRYDVNTAWMQPGIYFHATYSHYVLIEGNKSTTGEIHDKIHGANGFITSLRNRYWGRETSPHNKTTHLWVWSSYSTNHHTYALGNCLGTAGFHTNYLSTPTNNFPCPSRTIFRLGFFNPCDLTLNDNIHAFDTAVLEGNWDAATDGFVYNDFTADDIPDSKFYDSKPAYFGGMEWPIAGPGVTAEDGGYTNRLPAELTYYGEEIPAESSGGTAPNRKGPGSSIFLRGPGFAGPWQTNDYPMPELFTVWLPTPVAGMVPLFSMLEYQARDFDVQIIEYSEADEFLLEEH